MVLYDTFMPMFEKLKKTQQLIIKNNIMIPIGLV